MLLLESHLAERLKEELVSFPIEAKCMPLLNAVFGIGFRGGTLAALL